MSTIAVPQPANDPLGYAFAVAGAVLFSTKGIFIKLAYGQGVSTEMLLSLRMIVALPVYLVILLTLLRREDSLRAALTPKTVIASMAVGILGYYLSSYLDFLGLNYITAQYERLVLFTYPFFVLLFGVWFFGDRMVWRVVPAMLVSYAGLLVIFGWNLAVNPDGLVLGTLLVLGSAITFALYQHLAKRQMLVLGSALFTCIGMSTAALCAIAQNMVLAGPASYLALTPQIWLYGLALGLLGTVLPSFLMNAGMARIGARATSSTAAFGPVVTIIIAVIVLSEPFTLFHGVGTALVLAGSVLFARAERRARQAPG
ncbi:MAG: DMT family transporter [Alphaproteobacteria bacterium]|jgi:drug/metabolite transporter (DMT)-like permease|uniref:DMT family transporter n=1 Tax=Devosia sp. XGJD_8 TaxID=3391187 RepID=UPI001D745582|nr:DMT family transporter [Alphaproteobacteria bacterium]MBU1561780.1 DMT family transporter [Alphaproteobacteria bacterium]MBU2301659.1 DMT family transporter [Alphaproteobacteria bacterium]MBU2369815.1 DMT family transporter [Alphaproteobacteria bacterium]